MRAVLLRVCAALVALAMASTAPAADQVVNGSGQLTGATGVNVNGTLYDVTFVDGSCTGVYSGCDAITDFNFSTAADAFSAALALHDQVFLNTGSGNFDTDPGLTFGCIGTTDFCIVLIPYAPSVAGSDAVGSSVQNWTTVGSDVNISSTFPPTTDWNANNKVVFAIFTPSVPEPASWALMLLGFGFIVRAIRFRRTQIAAI